MNEKLTKQKNILDTEINELKTNINKDNNNAPKNQKLEQDYQNAQKMVNLMFHKTKEIIKVIDDFYNSNYTNFGNSDKQNEISYEPSFKKLKQIFDDFKYYKNKQPSSNNLYVNGDELNKLSIGSNFQTNTYRNSKSAQIQVSRFNDDRPTSQNKLTSNYINNNKQFVQKTLIKNENNLKTYFNRK